jgi:hypothetical protein
MPQVLLQHRSRQRLRGQDPVPAPVNRWLGHLTLLVEEGKEPVQSTDDVVDGGRRQPLGVCGLEPGIAILGSSTCQILREGRLPCRRDQHAEAFDRTIVVWIVAGA